MPDKRALAKEQRNFARTMLAKSKDLFGGAKPQSTAGKYSITGVQ
jgi:hypothetical protein